MTVPLWISFVAPELTKIPDDFTYKASVFSIDNFYDETLQNFTGDTVSNTIFGYGVVGKKDRILLIRNYFSVRKFSGDKIIEMQRWYGIDQKNGKHVLGYGDRDREGYLFAPRHLQLGQGFTYWHINYNTPAEMEFQDVEFIKGLTVYRYATYYHADQTEDLNHLPKVPETRGVNLDINLKLWIEPVTGRMIKYEDETIAYYYNISTGERLYLWNKFHNQFNEISIDEQVKTATWEKRKLWVIEKVIPIVFGITALVLLGYLFSKKVILAHREKKR